MVPYAQSAKTISCSRDYQVADIPNLIMEIRLIEHTNNTSATLQDDDEYDSPPITLKSFQNEENRPDFQSLVDIFCYQLPKNIGKHYRLILAF